MLTVLISIIAVLLSYFGVISKKPRVFFKITPVFKDEYVFLNLHIENCGDKPAFNIEIQLKEDFSDLINLYDKEEFLNKQDNIIKKENEMPKSNDPLFNFKFIEIDYMKDDLEQYITREHISKNNLSNCFNNSIKFLSGGDKQRIFMGVVSDKKGFLKKNFEINAKISFQEDLKLTFFTKNCLKFIITIFFSTTKLFNRINKLLRLMIKPFKLFEWVILNFLHIFDIYTGINYYLFKLIGKIKNDFMKFFKLFYLDLENDRILVYHEYNDFVKNKDTYPAEAVDSDLDEKLNLICEYINVKTKNLFFNDILYKTWEVKLTKDELKIMNNYRFLYGNGYKQYIDLFGRLYEEHCDEVIKNKNSFKKKYTSLILAMHNSGMLSEREKMQIKSIYYKHQNIIIKGNKCKRK